MAKHLERFLLPGDGSYGGKAGFWVNINIIKASLKSLSKGVLTSVVCVCVWAGRGGGGCLELHEHLPTPTQLKLQGWGTLKSENNIIKHRGRQTRVYLRKANMLCAQKANTRARTKDSAAQLHRITQFRGRCLQRGRFMSRRDISEVLRRHIRH